MNMLILLVREAVNCDPDTSGLVQVKVLQEIVSKSIVSVYMCYFDKRSDEKSYHVKFKISQRSDLCRDTAYLSVSFCRTSKINLSCYIHLFKFAVDLIAGYIYKILLLAVLTYQINILE